MTHPVFRPGLAVAAAAVAATFALPADAVRQAVPTIKVMGVDTVCDSFTLSTDSAGIVLTCVPPGTTAPGAPTGCIASVNGSSSVALPTSGGSASLSVTCASPSSGLTYNWSRNGSLGASTAASWTDTSATNPSLGANSSTVDKISSYQVQVCNGGACVTVPQSPLTATVPAAGAGGWNGTCPGFNNTRVLTLNWAAPSRLYTANLGLFTANDALVVKFTTGNNPTTTSLPRIAAAEYQSSPSTRHAVLSSTPCDFNPQAAAGASVVGSSITMIFAIEPGSGFGYYPVLQPNTTYYVNIKNVENASCAISNACDMFVDLVKPGGL
jgi:hypothetical protein